MAIRGVGRNIISINLRFRKFKNLRNIKRARLKLLNPYVCQDKHE